MPSNIRCNRRTLRIILDSNALFVPFQFKIDIVEQIQNLLNRNFELILLTPIRKELEKLALKGAPKMRKDASHALELIEEYKLVEIDRGYASSSVDDAILQAAKGWKCPVFTNDRVLRKKLRDINVPVIYLRKKSHLRIDGRI